MFVNPALLYLLFEMQPRQDSNQDRASDVGLELPVKKSQTVCLVRMPKKQFLYFLGSKKNYRLNVEKLEPELVKLFANRILTLSLSLSLSQTNTHYLRRTHTLSLAD